MCDTDDDLLPDLKNRDAEAWTIWYQRRSAGEWLSAMRRFRRAEFPAPAENAEDAVQGAFAQLSARDIDHCQQTPRYLLRYVVRNQCTAIIRQRWGREPEPGKQGRAQEVPMPISAGEELPFGDPRATSPLDGLIARETLDALTPDQRQALELWYGLGLTQRQVADAMGISFSKVRTLLDRARNRLRELYE